jgi:hypothetical protein
MHTNRIIRLAAVSDHPRRLRRGLMTLAAALTVAGLFVPSAAAQWGWGFGRGGYASTAGQAADYGMSEVLRAQGYNNLENSEAAKNWEEAKTLDIQNKMRWTETYFEMRKVNRESRAAEAGPPVTHEQAIRMAKTFATPRLNSTQIDPVTGHIEYPFVLMDDLYTAYRSEIDRFFAHRAATGGSVQFKDVEQVEGTVSKFIDALKGNVTKYPAGDYGKARNFLDSLAREARMPPG